jgi:hypothetical protein
MALQALKDSWDPSLTNRVKKVFERYGIQRMAVLSSVLADVFGKSGRYLLNCLLNGVELEEMIKGITCEKYQAEGGSY